MNKRPLIEGGYVFFARIFMEQPFFHINPDCFKFAMYLLADARREKDPFKAPKGDIIEQGQTCISLRIVAEDCAWYENRMKRKWSQQKVARMLDELQDVGFLIHNSDRRGTLITICDYALYQTGNNYKVNNSDKDGTRMEHAWNTHGTAMETNKSGNNGEIGDIGETNIPPNPLEGGTAGDASKTESFQLDTADKQKPKRERKPAQEMPAIPEALNTPAFRSAWTDFIDHRKSNRKPLSPKAAELNLKKCLELGPDTACSAIEQSIANGWIGIFEPKNTTPGVNGAKPKRDPRVPAHIPDHQAQMWILHQETNCYAHIFGDLHANRDID